MPLRRIDPENGNCPEGYEYVRGHRESSGKYVRPFCRRKPLWQRHIDKQMKKMDYAMDQVSKKMPEWEEKFNEDGKE